ncbi:copper chaperone PCu(A)C [uncultured Sulfitobacter sp.]|uniref:copper chaperone PCu(A)C n=1 Tax=uncultured Sulfitobacter sp. TaxID=191468 RepID=UPI0026164CD2|nr:copper chaperone PCu(A)C [uncultured Sulfitobacter sp.]
MRNRKATLSIVVLFALVAVVMAVVSVKLSPLDQSDAAFAVEEPYLRSSMSTSTTAAAFMVLRNITGTDDRLVGVSSALPGRVELHTHSQDVNGVMRMRAIEGGISIPDEAVHAFERGGDHLMFTGLQEPLTQGQLVPVTLVFERVGEVEIIIPVDLNR